MTGITSMAEPIPVLTLHQPWASLIGCGVKTIETRSWSTRYRGPIALHAGRTFVPQYGLGLGGFVAMLTITDPAYQGGQTTGRYSRVPRRAQTPTLFWPHIGPHARLREDKPEYSHTEHLPLGAVVATATLADCLPMVDGHADGMDYFGHRCEVREDPPADDGGLSLWLVDEDSSRYLDHEDDDPSLEVSDQRPFGDFTIGRFAWLLTDVQPLDVPVPFKGGRRLTRKWSPTG